MKKFLLRAVIVSCLMINVSQSHRFQTVGGQASDIQDFAYQAAYLVDGKLKCGASIISELCALTAGHCVDLHPKGIALRVKSTFEDSGGLLINITNFTVHPHYDRSRLCNDIAVLRLPYRLQFDELLRPVPLPNEFTSIPTNTKCVVSGWGAESEYDELPRELRSVSMYTVDSQTCQDNYNTSRVKFPICSSMFCAGVPGGLRDACNGDSGGPLVANGKQIGVVSSGYGCGVPDFPGIYTNVSIFREWIREICVV